MGTVWPTCFLRRPSHGARGPSAEIYLYNFPFFISYQNAYHGREVITRGDGESRRMRDVTKETRGVTREGVRCGKNSREEKETAAS
jgi:hypothetical protein